MLPATIEVWAVSVPAAAASALAAPSVTQPAPAAYADAARAPAAAAALAGGGEPPGAFDRLRAYRIDVSVLSGNLKQALTDFQKIMDDMPTSASGYCIDKIELNMGVSGSGGVAFIGSLEVGMEAAIKVTIKRSRE